MARNTVQCVLFSFFFFNVYGEYLFYGGNGIWGDNNLVKLEGSCLRYLTYFANATSDFTRCAITHARPIRLCEKCITFYLNVLQSHDTVLKAKDDSGHACKMVLVNLDRLQVIEGAFNYVFSLWKKAHCNNCFIVDNNGTLTTQLSNDTIKFQQLYNTTEDCIKKYYNVSSKTYEEEVCPNCTEKYCSLNEFYEKLKASVEDGFLCMDIVDTMNATRTKWSKELNCSTSALKAEIPLIISVALMLTTPIVFYSASKRFSVKAHNRLLRRQYYTIEERKRKQSKEAVKIRLPRISWLQYITVYLSIFSTRKGLGYSSAALQQVDLDDDRNFAQRNSLKSLL